MFDRLPSSSAFPFPDPSQVAKEESYSPSPRELARRIRMAIDGERRRGHLYRARYGKLRILAADVFRALRQNLAAGKMQKLAGHAMVPSIPGLVHWAQHRGFKRGCQKSQLAVDRRMLIDMIDREVRAMRDEAREGELDRPIIEPFGARVLPSAPMPRSMMA